MKGFLPELDMKGETRVKKMMDASAMSVGRRQ
jgi:hypothetical protein